MDPVFCEKRGYTFNLVQAEGEPAFVKPEGNTKQLINLTIEKDFYTELVAQAQAEGVTLNEYISELLKNKE